MRSPARWKTSPRELTGLGASARYHEHMNTTGGSAVPFDPELDACQVLGVIPAWVLDRLWPGFAPQTYKLYPASRGRGKPNHVTATGILCSSLARWRVSHRPRTCGAAHIAPAEQRSK